MPLTGKDTVSRQANMPQQTEHEESIEESRPPMSKTEGIFIDPTEKKVVTHDFN